MLKCTIYGKLDPSVTHWDDRRGATRMTRRGHCPLGWKPVSATWMKEEDLLG
ncbi:WPE palindromic element domain-containing protein [Wolbachia endosymbiont (group A) of Sicus ferrugineus]|uniref:WPE palindromic element domain-containing protein n=1 Tax=Wolbachia endosymbiont (group A) of Sicus ferrugineus TaxID=2954056 RepID=UPI002230A820|nr:WPE palindromic element domain-containing protein [Wolbachia endosymbiont (group A) of Sicus ferrugineus]